MRKQKLHNKQLRPWPTKRITVLLSAPVSARILWGNGKVLCIADVHALLVTPAKAYRMSVTIAQIPSPESHFTGKQ